MVQPIMLCHFAEYGISVHGSILIPLSSSEIIYQMTKLPSIRQNTIGHTRTCHPKCKDMLQDLLYGTNWDGAKLQLKIWRNLTHALS